jgi:hypothetical protein
MKKVSNAQTITVGISRRRGKLKTLRVDGIFILKTGRGDMCWILLAQNKVQLRDFVKKGDQTFGSIKSEEFIYQLFNYGLQNNRSAKQS